MKFKILSVTLVALGLNEAAMSADFSDPTWPCVQRKVENLSVGQMFPYVIPDMESTDAATLTEIEELSQRLALRKFTIEEATPWIDEFAAQHSQNSTLGALFVAAFDKISAQRTTVIDGIARYAGKQASLSERINAQRVEMTSLLEVSEPDYDKVDKIEEQLDWDERIYQDRVRALTYVCETPVLLEKRAFALAKIIQKHWQE